jgi:hypothetical protein
MVSGGSLQVSRVRRSFVRTVLALANQKPVSALCDTGSRSSLEGCICRDGRGVHSLPRSARPA